MGLEIDLCIQEIYLCIQEIYSCGVLNIADEMETETLRNMFLERQ
jgi:hypothetical protein